MLVFFAKIGSPAVLFQNWWQLIALGLLASIGMYLLFFEGVKKVKTQQVLVITSFEVLIAILLAMLVLAEYPPILTVIGGAAILAGIYLTTRK